MTVVYCLSQNNFRGGYVSPGTGAVGGTHYTSTNESVLNQCVNSEEVFTNVSRGVIV